MSEADRDKQRVRAFVKPILVAKVACYAEAEAVPLATGAAQLVCLGLEHYPTKERDRRELDRDGFECEWDKTHFIPHANEAKRLKVALDEDELARVRELAESEFESVPSMMNLLILAGFSKLTYGPPHPYWIEWKKFVAKQRAA